MARVVANMDDGFTALVNAPFEHSQNDGQLVGIKVGKKLIISMRYAAINRPCWQKGFQQPVFTPLEGGVVVVEGAEQFLISLSQFYFHEPTQQRKSVGV